ncbi:hypothetical protein FM076_26945 [Streptomyces albus subsp. chlorinus]|uniref:COG4315 family predicted lipoprotein n=1 Tax=Streptomyces albus TaxID=1888 RepID=UPI00156DEDF6|nr:hypothetical protein [Streptomyces albus]NSC24596.1 hypothetical protein [Streptomyces albus subsp. chlorinus]
MRNPARTAVYAATAMLCAAALGSCSADDEGKTSSAPAASQKKPTVAVRSTGLGKILVDGHGRTLYLFEADKKNTSKCSGGCAEAWPPVVVKGKAAPKAGHGVKKKLLDTGEREGGDRQVTYHGHPLYRYEGDSKAGATKGQGLDQFGAKWYVLDPSGKKITHKGKKPPKSPEKHDGGY